MLECRPSYAARRKLLLKIVPCEGKSRRPKLCQRSAQSRAGVSYYVEETAEQLSGFRKVSPISAIAWPSATAD